MTHTRQAAPIIQHLTQNGSRESQLSVSTACLPFISILLGALLFSCQQFQLEHVQDYSSMLPPKQLLYFSLTVQSKAERAGFPYEQIQKKFLQDKQLANFVAKRLLRSQAALGSHAQLYAVNQLQLKNTLFAGQMRKQSNWKQLDLGPASFLQLNQGQALTMPADHVLYFSFGADPANELARFHKLWPTASSNKKTQNLFARRFQELQEEQPLILYSSRLLELFASPMLQRAFPQVLGAFTNISQQFPVQQILVWIEIKDDSPSKFALHVELATNSLLLSKGLEAGFRLFLPSMIFRSKQEFIRKQLPNLILKADQSAFQLEIPLDQTSLRSIFDQLQFLSPKPTVDKT